MRGGTSTINFSDIAFATFTPGTAISIPFTANGATCRYTAIYSLDGIRNVLFSYTYRGVCAIDSSGNSLVIASGAKTDVSAYDYLIISVTNTQGSANTATLTLYS